VTAVRAAARALPAIAWAAAIFFLSSQPRLPRPPIVFAGADKVIHAAAYALLAVLLLWAVRAREPRSALSCAALATLYGVLDEVHQAFVPGRLPDVFDGLADAGGAFLVAAVWLRRAAGPSAWGRGAGGSPPVSAGGAQ
jgi:VanZ family protein